MNRTPTQPVDLYARLGLTPTATAAQIRAAYRRLAFRYHPDRNGGSPEAEALFKQLNDAYQQLADPARRLAYDQARGYMPRPQVPPPPRDPRRRPAGYRPPPAPPRTGPTRPGPTWAEGYLTARWLGGLAVVVAGIVALLQVQSRALGQSHYTQARQAATTGDTLRALDELTEALLHDRAFADAYRLRGTLRLRYRGDWAGAYPDFRAALAHAETDDDSLRRELARVCLKLNKNAEALAHLREAIRLNARSGWAFLLRGVAQAQLGDTTAACRDWAHARRLDEYRGVEFEERYCP